MMPRLALQRTSLAELCGIYVQCLQIAIDMIGAPKQSIDVHGARKELKRARALLRLLRDAVGDTTYRRVNIALRNIARPLSAPRDAEVLLDLIGELSKRHPKKLPPRATAGVRRNLQREKVRAYSSAVTRRRRHALVVRLRAIQADAARWRLEKDGAEIITTALKRTYRSGRRTLAAVRDEASPEHLHEWRKQTKYLWHEIEVLDPLAPKQVRKTAEELHRLADYLGDDHDLVVLVQRIARPDTTLTADIAAVLDTLIARRRSRLQDKAFALGKDLFGARPARFAKRFAQILRKHSR